MSERLWLAAGSVDAMPGDGMDGQLTLAGNVEATTQMLLQASEGVTQSSGVITTNELLLGGDADSESSGVFDLQQNNVITGVVGDVGRQPANLQHT